ncbi:hypothetical protein JCM8547_001984 [Rhodosporidiobolus lusitaniae]
MSALFDRALSGANKDGGRRTSSGGGGRASPYARNDSTGAGAGKWGHDGYASEQRQPASASSNSASSPAGGKGSLAARLGVSSGAGAAGAVGGNSGKSAKLVVKNLHYEVSEKELEFDRSGRSQGIAWIVYTSEDHAAQAKEAFNGAPAKGQPIEVEFDFRMDRAGERGQAREGSLLSRLGADASRGPKFASTSSGSRPARGRPERSVSGPTRGSGRGGRGGREGGRGEKREPKTNEDLDKELEAFMKAPEGSAKPTEVAPPVAAPAAEAGADVEMA